MNLLSAPLKQHGGASVSTGGSGLKRQSWRTPELWHGEFYDDWLGTPGALMHSILPGWALGTMDNPINLITSQAKMRLNYNAIC